MARILLIDDDPEFSGALRRELEQLEHHVQALDSADEGLRLLAPERHGIDLVLVDNKMPGMSGLEFIEALLGRDVRVPVILMTSAHNDQTAIQAMKIGAIDYVIKPLADSDILREIGPALREALALARRPKAVRLPDRDAKDDEDNSLIVGRSKPMLQVLMSIGRLVRVDDAVPVLILGETGTGKDLVARAIHTNGPRQKRPFVVINCAALNENLLDDELFGHEPGAFTGAEKLRKGRFEHAHGGTLFLDEVGDMPLVLQVKLLRVLENREVVRIGSNDPVKVDVRVLAATHRDLKALVREGRFRQDLFYRLEGMTIHLPPLRERREDVAPLARRFLDGLFGGASSAPTLHPSTLEALQNHSWPGNIRQLQKVLCRAAGVARGLEIMPTDLDFGEMDAGADASGSANEAGAIVSLRQAIAWAWQSSQPDLWPLLQQHLECELLRYAMEQPGLSQVQLARRLGMARNTLRARLKQYGLEEADGES
jgi:DNA-binding NtrC family response regulator